MTSDPKLPCDLEREIFEVTGGLYPRMIPTLLRVARRVLAWLEPMLYKTMNLDPNTYARFIASSRSKPPAFLGQSVRHLIIPHDTDIDEAEFIVALKLCTGLTRVAGAGAVINQRLLQVLGPLRLQRLGTFLMQLFPGSKAINPAHPIFAHITHLDVFDDIQEGLLRVCEQIPTLPALTHLSLNHIVSWPILQTLLELCPRLEVLVILFQRSTFKEGKNWVAHTPIHDVRFVAMVYRQWWEALNDAPNYWTRGEEFIECKKRKDIDANCFWVE